MKNLIGYWPNLDRAYEIALIGNFSIQIVFQPDYVTGFEDYELIKQFYTGVNFVEKGDLIIEIYNPDLNTNTARYESIEKIKERVKTTNYKQPDNYLHEANQQLLKVATKRLGLSINDRETIMSISKVIASMDRSDKIDTVHTAEAIQYKAYTHEGCNAENKGINFGKGIFISNTELYDKTDIKNAISYLTKLLN